VAARTIGKSFIGSNIIRQKGLSRGCLVYAQLAFYNDHVGHSRQKTRSKRSSKRKRTKLEKLQRRRGILKPRHICYKKKGPNSDEKCTPGDTKPAGDGCNNYICTNDGTWGAITIVGCFKPDQQYVENVGYSCRKKLVGPRTKQPFEFQDYLKARKICTAMSSCMGVLRVNCFRTGEKLFLCESGHRIKRTKSKYCVAKKLDAEAMTSVETPHHDTFESVEPIGSIDESEDENEDRSVDNDRDEDQTDDKKGIFKNKECSGKPSRSCTCNGCVCRNGEWVATTRMACGD